MANTCGKIFNGIKLGIYLGFIESFITIFIVSHSEIVSYSGPNINIEPGSGWWLNHLFITVLLYVLIGTALGAAFVLIEYSTKRPVPYLTVLTWSLLGSTIIFIIFDTILINDLEFVYYPFKRIIVVFLVLTFGLLCSLIFSGIDKIEKMFRLENKSCFITFPMMTGLLGIIYSYLIDTYFWLEIEQYKIEIIIMGLITGIVAGLVWCSIFRSLKHQISDHNKLTTRAALFFGLTLVTIFLIEMTTTLLINKPDVILKYFVIFVGINSVILGFLPGYFLGKLLIRKMILT